jgi:hypothetical protein
MIKPVDQLWMQEIHTLTDVLDFQNVAGLKKNRCTFSGRMRVPKFAWGACEVH